MATNRTAGRRYNPRTPSKVDISSNLFTDFVDTRKHGLFDDLVTYDTIIGNGRWFDGTGAPSAVRNIGIRDGHIVAISPHDLDAKDCPQVTDATGKWVLPGMLDIHTHYDVEVLNGPSLSESLRHGVTTVMLGSCSLSTVHADGVDAGDIFGRVEAIPREHVISAVDDHKTWMNAEEYIQALEARPLGPNLAAFIGHSDMRAATMGLDRATQKNQRPTKSEQAQMERMLSEALRAGFVGMSSQQLLFDKLDGEVCRSRTLPSTYAKPRELRRLKSLLRRTGRILQSGPDIANPLNLGSQIVQSLGVFRNPLKTSLLSAADVKANPYAIWAMGPAARLINRLGGNFRWQHLPVPFEVYADATLDDYAEDRVDQYGGLARMVNRNDDTVNAVFVGGRAVFLDGKATDLVGKQRTGRFLRAAHKSPAPALEGELANVS